MFVKYLIFISGLLASLILTTNPAGAVQAHGGSEGLVVHQIGHLLFIIGMGHLTFRIYRGRLQGQGWFEFKAFLWLIILWNILTLSGHWLNELISAEQFIQTNGKTIAFSITQATDVFYYITRLDHMLLVPSFIFLLSALRKWRMEE